MSYDVSLKIYTGNIDALVVDCGNYTSNVASMFHDAGVGLQDMHDMTCRDAAPILKKGVQAMAADPKKYKAMNPKNGWGDYEGALDYLKGILGACETHPLATLDVSA